MCNFLLHFCEFSLIPPLGQTPQGDTVSGAGYALMMPPPPPVHRLPAKLPIPPLPPKPPVPVRAPPLPTPATSPRKVRFLVTAGRVCVGDVNVLGACETDLKSPTIVKISTHPACDAANNNNNELYLSYRSPWGYNRQERFIHRDSGRGEGDARPILITGGPLVSPTTQTVRPPPLLMHNCL